MDGSVHQVRKLRERAARWRDLAGGALPFDVTRQIVAAAEEAEAEAAGLEARIETAYRKVDRRNAA